MELYVDEMLECFVKEGVKNVFLIVLGFVVDCIEILEEFDIEGKSEFFESGGENYSCVLCFNVLV